MQIETLLKQGKTAVEVREAMRANGVKVGLPTIGKEAKRLGIELRRGPNPGEGGRPPKGESTRRGRGVNLTPEAWRRLDKSRRPGETISDALERIVRQTTDN